jgi:hypothetical protein
MPGRDREGFCRSDRPGRVDLHCAAPERIDGQCSSSGPGSLLGFVIGRLMGSDGESTVNDQPHQDEDGD